MKIYVASGLENREQVKRIMGRLREMGHEITYDWTEHGSVQGEPEKYCPTAMSEAQGVAAADVVVGIIPGGRGTHFELGIAWANGIPVLLLIPPERAEPTTVFWFLPGVMRFDCEGRLLDALKPYGLKLLAELHRHPPVFRGKP